MRNIYILGLSFIESSYNFGATISICLPLSLSCYKNLFHLPNHKFTRTTNHFTSPLFTPLHLTSPHFTPLHHTSPHISPFFWHHYNTLCFRLQMISIYDFLISYLVVSFMAGQTFSLYLSLDLPISIFILLSTVIALSQLSFSYK